MVRVLKTTVALYGIPRSDVRRKYLDITFDSDRAITNLTPAKTSAAKEQNSPGTESHLRDREVSSKIVSNPVRINNIQN
jgi:hypothetical protein